MKNLVVLFLIFFISSCSNKKCEKAYYSEGLLKKEICYVNGVRHGLTKEYYKSGKIKTIAKFKKGNINDTIKGFYENGRLEFIQFRSANGLDSIYYYKKNSSDLMAKGKVLNGKVSGWVKYYNEKGDKVISCKEFLYIDGEEKPYVNQTLYYGPKGELMTEKSAFFEIKIEDTLEIDKEYELYIKYNPSISKKSKVIFCYHHKIEDNFKNLDNLELNTLTLNDSLEYTIKVKYSSIGNKNLRGFFLEKYTSIEKNNKNDTLVDV